MIAQAVKKHAKIAQEQGKPANRESLSWCQPRVMSLVAAIGYVRVTVVYKGDVLLSTKPKLYWGKEKGNGHLLFCYSDL